MCSTTRMAQARRRRVPHNRSYTAALAATAMRGVRGAGHEVDLIDLIEDGFIPVMTKDDLAGWRLKSVVDPVAADYQRRLMEADHLALVIELTHTADTLIVPMVVATVLATLVTRYLDGYSIYSLRLPAQSLLRH